MMKRTIVIGVTMAMLLAANLARSEDCGIANPSFEDDGRIDDIAVQEPNGWSVELPANLFGGYVFYDAPTDGPYNLTLYTIRRATFVAGDMATVSQEIDLTSVTKIVFDVELAMEFTSYAWDPNVCTAVVLIDDDVVWESSSASADVTGVYLDQSYEVERKYMTPGPHKLSLGIRVNVDEYVRNSYITHWDMIDCNLYCGGAERIEGDINGDCCVDANDLKLLAELWLSDDVDADDPANLSDIGDSSDVDTIIDFRDFAVYADDWDGSMMVLEAIAAYWLDDVVDPYYEYNLFGRPRGEINFFDLAVFANNWLECSVGEEQ